jgi:hypothetical protein
MRRAGVPPHGELETRCVVNQSRCEPDSHRVAGLCPASRSCGEPEPHHAASRHLSEFETAVEEAKATSERASDSVSDSSSWQLSAWASERARARAS